MPAVCYLVVPPGLGSENVLQSIPSACGPASGQLRYAGAGRHETSIRNPETINVSISNICGVAIASLPD